MDIFKRTFSFSLEMCGGCTFSACSIPRKQYGLLVLRNTRRLQYMDENARLRLMLDEWSARSAKLEIALNFQIRRGDGLQSQLQVDEEDRTSA